MLPKDEKNNIFKVILIKYLSDLLVTNLLLRLVSIHVSAGRTTALDVRTPLLTSNPSLCNKSLRARNIEHISNFCDGLGSLCRDMLWLWPIETDNANHKKIFLSSEKNKLILKQKNLTATFGKSLFQTKYRMRYAIYVLQKTKDLAINQTMVAYGNRQKAIAIARANNSDLLESLKHLMETRL